MEVRRFMSSEAANSDLDTIRNLVDRAFDGGFTDEDWEHSVGGWHVVAVEQGTIVAHASLVRRLIDVGEKRFDTGYVEAVGVTPSGQGQGLGTAVMGSITELIASHHELGALSTGEHHFYERLGWERWQGPTYVRARGQRIRTAEEDDGIMVLRVGPSLDLDLNSPISCERRIGDDW